MKDIRYTTKGTCSREILVTLDDEHDNVIVDCRFIGGCMGNTQGVARLVTGMTAREAVERLKGIQCGGKGTSCPDQLARALEANI